MPTPLGFEMEPITLPIAELLPRRPLEPRRLAGKKYARILASIREVGIIEMPLVYLRPDGRYEIIDGHLRLEALKALGATQVRCLVTLSPDRYSVITHINKVTAIQEHFMIVQAIAHGVSEDRIARALQVDIKSIQLKCHLLQGICPEAVRLLEKTAVSAATLGLLKKVTPARQVEMAEMMLTAHNFSVPFCRGLLLATRKDLLVESARHKARSSATTDYVELVKMQEELETLQRDLQAYEDHYGQNFLNLVVARGYLAKLLANAHVNRLLHERYPEIATAMQHIVDSVSLEG